MSSIFPLAVKSSKCLYFWLRKAYFFCTRNHGEIHHFPVGCGHCVNSSTNGCGPLSPVRIRWPPFLNMLCDVQKKVFHVIPKFSTPLCSCGREMIVNPKHGWKCTVCGKSFYFAIEKPFDWFGYRINFNLDEDLVS